jgi:enoyl-[acyl-carrier-protein] reductase (NADH)
VLIDVEKTVVTDEQVKAFAAEQCVKRRIVLADVTQLCLFPSSELSDGMTGHVLNVDGSWGHALSFLPIRIADP